MSSEGGSSDKLTSFIRDEINRLYQLINKNTAESSSLRTLLNEFELKVQIKVRENELEISKLRSFKHKIEGSELTLLQFVSDFNARLSILEKAEKVIDEKEAKKMQNKKDMWMLFMKYGLYSALVMGLFEVIIKSIKMAVT